MHLYVSRHGRTNFNELHICNSDPTVDVHLTEKGIAQTKTLAQELRDKEFEIIYISDLPRTKQTADIINEHHNVSLIKDDRLNDNKSGFEGRPVKDWVKAVEDSGDIANAKFNDGESINDVKARVQAFLQDLKTKPYKNIMIVTHGMVVQIMWELANNVTDTELFGYKVEQGIYLEFDLDQLLR